MDIRDWINVFHTGRADATLARLYGADDEVLDTQRRRYIAAAERFGELFGERSDVRAYSAPGRTEIGGNHTDHQRGCALAAAVNLDVISFVSFHDEGVIRLYSEGYGMTTIDLADLSVHEGEKGSTAGIIRGVAARFEQMGVKVGGFDAYAASDVLGGSGLSSSAAFETLVGTMIDLYYNNGDEGAVSIAKIGQYAENAYFGKGSGLLDQTVCSVGGFVFIDFADAENPVVEQHSFDFESAGYRLCITDTKGSHSDLTDDYVAVPAEMRSVAACFHKDVLHEVDEQAFYDAIPSLRSRCSDRALLRAIHFFGENRRAREEAAALDRGDLDEFFRLFCASAHSSANLLQNLYSTGKPTEQGITLAIAVSKLVLGQGAPVRVHGGGFAGTVQAFVSFEKTEEYRRKMDALFGEGSCYVLRIRPVGGCEILPD